MNQLFIICVFIIFCKVYGFTNSKGINRICKIKMSMTPVGGSNVALVTPMKLNGDIDFKALENLLEWHFEEGTEGIVLLGTTGEAQTINMEERSDIIKKAVSVIGGKIPIIVGTGAVNPLDVLQLTENAKQCGADASLIVTPFYVKPPQRALVKHFNTIADKVDLPMILYNCPGRTGVDMDIDTISKLSKHQNIVGVKDASGDLKRVSELRVNCEKYFLLYGGDDDIGCDFVMMGGDGVISVTANVFPKLESQMLKYAKLEYYENAKKINSELMPLHKSLFLESNPIPVKRALNMIGKIESGIRPPLTHLDAKHYIKLKNSITQLLK